MSSHQKAWSVIAAGKHFVERYTINLLNPARGEVDQLTLITTSDSQYERLNNMLLKVYIVGENFHGHELQIWSHSESLFQELFGD